MPTLNDTPTAMNTPIEQMPAGREMDALIATQVLGWAQRRNGRPIPSFEDIDWCYDFVPAQFQGNREHRQPLPHFSTDIAAAWEVVRALNKKGFEVRLNELIPYRGREDNLSRCLVTYDEDEEDTLEWKAMADEAPEAICRAALLASATPVAGQEGGADGRE
jgi:hypothetical protein